MFNAQKLKKENIVEFVLYMWQIEHLIRASGFDIEKLSSPYEIDDASQKAKLKNWYEDLIRMMETENLQREGHLQVLKNIVSDLNDLHLRLLNIPTEQKYHKLYSFAKSNIQIFSQKYQKTGISEVELCLEALFLTALRKISGEEVKPETADAVKTIGKLMAELASKYRDREKQPDNFF